MALIIKYIKKQEGKVSKPSNTICEYKSGIVDDEKIVAFSTKGSVDRKIAGANSQTLHFNKSSAMEFIDILKKEFNL